MNRFFLTSIAAATVCVALNAAAVPAGKVLFAQEGAEIVSGKGERRLAKRGDVIEAGERLTTPAQGISQVLLPDGSLVVLRPGSDLRLDSPETPDKSAPVLKLEGGALRLIGSELMDSRKPSALTLQSGLATLKLSGADLETAVIRSTDVARPAGVTDAGSYTRLLLGTGSVGTAGFADAVLPQRQVAFVGTQSIAPVVVSTVSSDLFNAPLPSNLRSGTVATSLATTSTLTSNLGGSLNLSSRTAASTTAAPLVSSVPMPTSTSPTAVSSVTAPIVTRMPVLTNVITRPCTTVTIGGRRVCI